MYRFDLNFGGADRTDDDNDLRAADSDFESDSDSSDEQSWGSLDRRLLQRIASFLPRQSDLRAFCLVNKDWTQAATPQLWAYPQFSAPEQLAAFLRVLTDRPHVYGPHIRGIRFTLTSHYDRHLMSPYYHDGDSEALDVELPTLLEIAQGKHVLSTDPAILRSLLHGSDLTSPPLAFKFARACSPIDALSIYGFRLRDKYVVNELMRWRLRELNIIGMPRKPLANLGFLLHNLRSLRSLRLESDVPLSADVWSAVALRLSALDQLRIWAPDIAGAQLVRLLVSAPKHLRVFHLVGMNSNVGDDLVQMVVQASTQLQSLVVYGSNITAQSAHTALCYGHHLTHLELMRDSPEASASTVYEGLPAIAASKLNALSLCNLAVSNTLIAAAAGVVTRLRTLYIRGTPCLDGEPLGQLLSASTDLVAVGLYDSPCLSDAALQGLSNGPSAEKLHVLLVRQCRMQSDGVERILPALPNLKHFSVVGTETVQQLFTYELAEATVDNAPSDQIPSPAIKRSFKTMYPPDHFFCQSDPAVAAASSDVARDIAAYSAMPPPPTPRTAWHSYSARRFVPGLLAFANTNAANGAKRARAATVSGDSTVPTDEDGTVKGGRLRSISEQPSNFDPIIIHEGSDYAPSPQSEHSASFSPMNHTDSADYTPASAAYEVNAEAESIKDGSRSLDPESTNEKSRILEIGSGAIAAAGIAGAAAIAAGIAANTDNVESEEQKSEQSDQPVEEAIADAVANDITEPAARSIDKNIESALNGSPDAGIVAPAAAAEELVDENIVAGGTEPESPDYKDASPCAEKNDIVSQDIAEDMASACESELQIPVPSPSATDSIAEQPAVSVDNETVDSIEDITKSPDQADKDDMPAEPEQPLSGQIVSREAAIDTPMVEQPNSEDVNASAAVAAQELSAQPKDIEPASDPKPEEDEKADGLESTEDKTEPEAIAGESEADVSSDAVLVPPESAEPVSELADKDNVNAPEAESRDITLSSEVVEEATELDADAASITREIAVDPESIVPAQGSIKGPTVPTIKEPFMSEPPVETSGQPDLPVENNSIADEPVVSTAEESSVPVTMDTESPVAEKSSILEASEEAIDQPDEPTAKDSAVDKAAAPTAERATEQPDVSIPDLAEGKESNAIAVEESVISKTDSIGIQVPNTDRSIASEAEEAVIEGPAVPATEASNGDQPAEHAAEEPIAEKLAVEDLISESVEEQISKQDPIVDDSATTTMEGPAMDKANAPEVEGAVAEGTAIDAYTPAEHAADEKVLDEPSISMAEKESAGVNEPVEKGATVEVPVALKAEEDSTDVSTDPVTVESTNEEISMPATDKPGIEEPVAPAQGKVTDAEPIALELEAGVAEDSAELAIKGSTSEEPAVEEAIAHVAKETVAEGPVASITEVPTVDIAAPCAEEEPNASVARDTAVDAIDQDAPNFVADMAATEDSVEPVTEDPLAEKPVLEELIVSEPAAPITEEPALLAAEKSTAEELSVPMMEEIASVEETSTPAMGETAEKAQPVDKADVPSEVQPETIEPATGETITKDIAVEEPSASVIEEAAAKDPEYAASTVEVSVDNEAIDSATEQLITEQSIEPEVDEPAKNESEAPVARSFVNDGIAEATAEDTIVSSVEEAAVQDAVAPEKEEPLAQQIVQPSAEVQPAGSAEELLTNDPIEPKAEESAKSESEMPVSEGPVSASVVAPTAEESAEIKVDMSKVDEPAAEKPNVPVVNAETEESTTSATEDVAAEKLSTPSANNTAEEPVAEEFVVEESAVQVPREIVDEPSVPTAKEPAVEKDVALSVEDSVEPKSDEPVVDETTIPDVKETAVEETAESMAEEAAVVQDPVIPATEAPLAEETAAPESKEVAATEEATAPVIDDIAVDEPTREEPVASGVEDTTAEEPVEPEIAGLVGEESIAPEAKEAVAEEETTPATEEATVPVTDDISIDKPAREEPPAPASGDLDVQKLALSAVEESAEGGDAGEPIAKEEAIDQSAMPVAEELLEPESTEQVAENNSASEFKEAKVIAASTIAESTAENLVSEEPTLPASEDPIALESAASATEEPVAEEPALSTAESAITEESASKNVELETKEAVTEEPIEEQPAVLTEEDPVVSRTTDPIEEVAAMPAAMESATANPATEESGEPTTEEASAPAAEELAPKELAVPELEKPAVEDFVEPAEEVLIKPLVEEPVVAPVTDIPLLETETERSVLATEEQPLEKETESVPAEAAQVPAETTLAAIKEVDVSEAETTAIKESAAVKAEMNNTSEAKELAVEESVVEVDAAKDPAMPIARDVAVEKDNAPTAEGSTVSEPAEPEVDEPIALATDAVVSKDQDKPVEKVAVDDAASISDEVPVQAADEPADSDSIEPEVCVVESPDLIEPVSMKTDEPATSSLQEPVSKSVEEPEDTVMSALAKSADNEPKDPATIDADAVTTSPVDVVKEVPANMPAVRSVTEEEVTEAEDPAQLVDETAASATDSVPEAPEIQVSESEVKDSSSAEASGEFAEPNAEAESPVVDADGSTNVAVKEVDAPDSIELEAADSLANVSDEEPAVLPSSEQTIGAVEAPTSLDVQGGVGPETNESDNLSTGEVLPAATEQIVPLTSEAIEEEPVLIGLPAPDKYAFDTAENSDKPSDAAEATSPAEKPEALPAEDHSEDKAESASIPAKPDADDLASADIPEKIPESLPDDADLKTEPTAAKDSAPDIADEAKEKSLIADPELEDTAAMNSQLAPASVDEKSAADTKTAPEPVPDETAGNLARSVEEPVAEALVPQAEPAVEQPVNLAAESAAEPNADNDAGSVAEMPIQPVAEVEEKPKELTYLAGAPDAEASETGANNAALSADFQESGNSVSRSISGGVETKEAVEAPVSQTAADGVQDTSIKPEPTAISGNMAEMAAGLSLGLAATGASLAALSTKNDSDKDVEEQHAQGSSLEEDSKRSAAEPEPEFIEQSERSPGGFESLSSYEMVDHDDKPADDLEHAVEDRAAPAQEPTAQNLTGQAESAPHLGSLSPMVPDESMGPTSPDNRSERTAPVVIGTIEAVNQEPRSDPNEPEQQFAEPKARTEPVDKDELESSQEIAELVRSMTSVSSKQASAEEAAPQAEQAAAAFEQSRDLALDDSPHSQVSYNRSDSQASQPLADTAAETAADNASDRGLSKRDSAISMGKQQEELDVRSATTDDEIGTVPTDTQYKPMVEQAVPESEPTPTDSAFSTPAFPQYFSHPDTQQFQEQGAGIQRHEVPRASESLVSKSKSGRSKDVLMELNIETPYHGRQLLQLRANDFIDGKCEEFCEMYDMIDLLPGMKTLVRGKVERRLARRRERALQAAAASAAKGKQPY
ncbi:hypothetical protein IWW36_001960 [Coemansia brasiliensis]|uniref:F-box domain-containing protein n=1 Tax=Coemansia brasiliensis TaxID=2650707 RepID=A0A9W8IFR7_9FUNG|nr:hypothetical protein IWW36_001960 [Coemansia brasiliensis]